MDFEDDFCHVCGLETPNLYDGMCGRCHAMDYADDVSDDDTDDTTDDDSDNFENCRECGLLIPLSPFTMCDDCLSQLDEPPYF